MLNNAMNANGQQDRLIRYVLIGAMVLLQYPLWLGDSSLFHLINLKQQINKQSSENAVLAERNRALAAEVVDLKQGYEAVEERARSELGMVQQGEVFYHVLTPEGQSAR